MLQRLVLKRLEKLAFGVKFSDQVSHISKKMQQQQQTTYILSFVPLFVNYYTIQTVWINKVSRNKKQSNKTYKTEDLCRTVNKKHPVHFCLFQNTQFLSFKYELI